MCPSQDNHLELSNLPSENYGLISSLRYASLPLKSVTSTCHSLWAGLLSPTLFNLYKKDVHTHTHTPSYHSNLAFCVLSLV